MCTLSFRARRRLSFKGKRILVVSCRVPTPDRDGGSLRIFRILKILKSLSYKVVFVPSFPSSWAPFDQTLGEDTLRLQEAGIEVSVPSPLDAVEEHVRQSGETYDAVLLSGGVYTAVRHFRSIRRYAPQALLLFDTVDLHFIREFREAKLAGSMHRLKRAMEIKRLELEIARNADCTLVVSNVEKSILEKEVPGVRVHEISNIHEIRGSNRLFAERRDIMFIGAFQHTPNCDAVFHLVNDIFPLIREAIPGVLLYVIGSNPTPEIMGLGAEDVVITGYVPDPSDYFNRCRLSVAPLRFGAGVKGKILQSMEYGLPVVTTSIGAEGMYLRNGHTVLLADNAGDFRDAVVELYENGILWQRLSTNGFDTITRHFSSETARARLYDLLPKAC
jgi:glycosyltransferase involved in cell wall biosynthesis